MKCNEIRVFVPSKDYEVSKAFYQALGFRMEFVSDELSLFENGSSTFFLGKFYNQELAEHLMMQLSVTDTEAVFALVVELKEFEFRYKPIQVERWG